MSRDSPSDGHLIIGLFKAAGPPAKGEGERGEEEGLKGSWVDSVG